MRTLTSLAALTALALSPFALTGCDRQSESPAQTESHTEGLADAQAEFFRNLATYCNQSFEGTIVEDTTGNPDFTSGPLIMHVMRCEEGRILVPFHVGENHSRTWIFTTTDTGLRLKHDHRQEDGSDDDLTMYGGDTQSAGSATRQEFHADAHTAELLPEAATNVWTVELIPGERYSYALRREGTDRRFRVDFDLTRPVETPPMPWGWE
ncbi:MAG: hypothetical protein ACNA8P_01435 [Phycisphaerales bacterium]